MLLNLATSTRDIAPFSFNENLFVASDIVVAKKNDKSGGKTFFHLFYYYHCNWESKKIFKVVSTDKNNKNID